MRESEIENELVAQVRAAGGEVRKVRWIGRRGAPDRVVMLPDGRLVWVEVKAPGARPTPQQRREHARMQAVGQVVRVVDSVDAIGEVLA